MSESEKQSTTKRPTRNVTAADLGLRGSEDLFDAGLRVKRERDRLLLALHRIRNKVEIARVTPQDGKWAVQTLDAIDEIAQNAIRDGS